MTHRVLPVVFLLGCGGGFGSGGIFGSGGVTPLSDANNFRYISDVSVPVYQTIPSADIEVCWDAVTEDLYCDAVNPSADIDLLTLIRFRYLTAGEIEEKINTDSFRQSEQSGFVDEETVNGQICTQLSDLSFSGTTVSTPDMYQVDSAYLLTAATGTTPGQGTRAMAILLPTKGETNADVWLESACGVLDFAGDITSLAPVSLPLDGPWILDWSGLTENGLGNPMNLSDVDGVMLGHYTGTDLATLEAQLIDLEDLADRVWSAPLSSTAGYDLADLPGFTGFTEDGIWIMALTCSTCLSPAPLFLTVIEPAAE